MRVPIDNDEAENIRAVTMHVCKFFYGCCLVWISGIRLARRLKKSNANGRGRVDVCSNESE